MRLDLFDEARGLEFGDDAPARLEAVEAVITRGRRVADLRIGGQHIDQRQSVPLADFVVVEVVGGSHLDAARAECRVDEVVGDHRYFAVGQRQRERRPAEPAVALVVRMECDGGVAEQRLRPGRRDSHVTIAVGERIADVPERAILSSDCTSRSDSAVFSTGSQFTSRLPR